jgi:hypothetical protein
MFEKMAGSIGPQKNQIRKENRYNLHGEELLVLYSSSEIIKFNKSKRIRWKVSVDEMYIT